MNGGMMVNESKVFALDNVVLFSILISSVNVDTWWRVCLCAATSQQFNCLGMIMIDDTFIRLPMYFPFYYMLRAWIGELRASSCFHAPENLINSNSSSTSKM